MKLKHWLALLSLTTTINLPALAEDINQEMRKAGNSLSALIPYIYNDTRFRAAENQAFIATELDQLIHSMQTQPHLLQRHAVVRQISQASLVDQLKQARHLFNTGNYATSQYLLSSAPILCSSCHIQDGVMASGATTVSRELFANPFSYAEFNYYVRNYAIAEAAYLEYLQRADIKNSRISGGKTLERLLDITLITDNDLTLSREKLNRYQQIEGLDPDLLQRIDQWHKGIDYLAQNASRFKPVEIQMYETLGANFNLKHEFILDEVTRPMALAWRAQMQRDVMKTDARIEVARNLYLIAILQRILGEQTETSLANLYLKECVKLAVPDYSHRCLNEFESHLYFYYGGSSGEEPPAEALDELKKLRKLARKSN